MFLCRQACHVWIQIVFFLPLFPFSCFTALLGPQYNTGWKWTMSLSTGENNPSFTAGCDDNCMILWCFCQSEPPSPPLGPWPTATVLPCPKFLVSRINLLRSAFGFRWQAFPSASESSFLPPFYFAKSFYFEWKLNFIECCFCIYRCNRVTFPI